MTHRRIASSSRPPRLWPRFARALIGAALVATATTSGCGSEKPPTRPEASQEARRPAGPLYSPFVVSVSDVPHAAFSEISFKDVGLTASNRSPLVYETIAESLALELRLDPDAPLMSRVDYAPEQAKPERHLACEAGHIYVDLWQSSDRYGYSLWSGCSEDDRFAWNEVEEAPGASGIATLTASIALSLRSAVAQQCFVRRC